MDPSAPAARCSLLLALVSLCASSHFPQASADGEDVRAGHARMLAVLAEIHEKRDRQNLYLGDKQLERARQLLAQANEETPRKMLARIHYDLGGFLLQAGENQEAIEQLLASWELIRVLAADDWPPFASKLPYDLGVAYMRLGETRNCVARHTTRSCILPISEEGIHTDQTGSREAMKWFRESMLRDPTNEALVLCARWLLNIAAMTVGEWPDDLTEAERIAPEVYGLAGDFPRFEDVAPKLGVNSFDLCGGAVVEDLNGDGRLDLLSSTWNTNGQLRYWTNQGDGTFRERTVEAGLLGLWGGLNLASADYDGDGDVDVLVLRGAWLSGKSSEMPNSLLRNDGGRFVDVTYAAGLAEPFRPTQTAGWRDYDLDGDLDLYVGNEASPQSPHSCQLFRNQGDGTFVDVAAAAGVTNGFYAKGVAWGDYDGDGWPDLYVSNLNSPNRLYRNLGDGTFEDVANELSVGWPLLSFPTWFFDYDNDGDLDLYVSSYASGPFEGGYQLAPIVASYLGLDVARFGGEAPRIYRNEGGSFTNVTEEVGALRVTLPMGANFGDVDGDGFLDFYLGTGYPYYDGLIPNVMYWNRGGKRFEDVSTSSGMGHLQKGHAVAFGDLDNDGDLDVFEQMGGAYLGDAFGNALFENPGFGHRWIKVRLHGVSENRSGIGARLRVTLEDPDDSTRVVHREVTTGGSFGCSSVTQHVGLGGALRIRSLEVFWPRSRETQVFEDVPLDRRLVITEGEKELEVVEEQPFRFR